MHQQQQQENRQQSPNVFGHAFRNTFGTLQRSAMPQTQDTRSGLENGDGCMAPIGPPRPDYDDDDDTEDMINHPADIHRPLGRENGVGNFGYRGNNIENGVGFDPNVSIPRRMNSSLNDGDEDITNDGNDFHQIRHRFLCAQLTDCAKVIELNALKMSQFASAGSWRQPHILRPNLGAVRDTTYTVEAALGELLELVEHLVRLRGDNDSNTWASTMHSMTVPLRSANAMIVRCRANLDATGWSAAVLMRPADGTASGGSSGSEHHDALDQFIAILQHVCFLYFDGNFVIHYDDTCSIIELILLCSK